ncbi:carbonic anhydrase 4-like [Gadus macrocephalus]|uniref:carbonic anhydrase 4-like n=1 Tax=Gadus macrocephalus TaxID=80720 RepID=UPI0028CB4B04|nr:carbonic anhydrase 4-like [Gadus macrocephalus]
MSLFILALCVCTATMTYASTADDWCYTGCDHTPTKWPELAGTYCGGHRQSPINIASSGAVTDPELHAFTFTNFTAQHALGMLVNNGHTVKGKVVPGHLEVSGGGLNHTYEVLQFHLHWGDTELHPGSEHMLNDHRYPMEMHIVCQKKGLNQSQALMDPTGFAVLAFFISATEEGPQKPWEDLTSYLGNITSAGSEVNVSHSLSISDLLGEVNRTKFYRYTGSLTTPGCQEAVIWTVFQEPILVHTDLIKLFPSKAHLSNLYRPIQELHGRHVYASPAATVGGQEHAWCYDSHCHFSPDLWSTLPEAFCGGKQQSPVDIDSKEVKENSSLEDFTFTHFDDKKALKYVTNTGHTVKFVLNDGVELSRGGLGHVYSALQFHFHWGDESDHPKGSEHMVDSVRYPMEMHIVHKRKDLSIEEAKATKDGLAVLGFFIEATDGGKGKNAGTESDHASGTSSTTDYWTKLTSYLPAVQTVGSNTSVTEDMSLDDLLGDVDRSSFYRYMGSLTTPTCNEAVVWTVFKQPIKIDKKLMDAFPLEMGYKQVYRPAQALGSRAVTTRSSSSFAPAPSCTATLLLLLLSLLGPLSATV